MQGCLHGAGEDGGQEHGGAGPVILLVVGGKQGHAGAGQEGGHGHVLADLTRDIHTFLPEHIFAYFLVGDLLFNNLWNVLEDVAGDWLTIVCVHSVPKLVHHVLAVLTGHIHTVLLGHLVADVLGDAVALLLVVDSLALLSELVALLLRHPGADLLVHLATLPVQGNPGPPPQLGVGGHRGEAVDSVTN